MSRVIGGSSSSEAYDRMLEEQRQKHSETMQQNYHQRDRIRVYNDNATYQNAERSRPIESIEQDNSRKERQFSNNGNYLDFYA